MAGLFADHCVTATIINNVISLVTFKGITHIVVATETPPFCFLAADNTTV
jgi:hypothetical protein